MEPHDRKQEPSIDLRADDAAWEQLQKEHLLRSVSEIEAEHGPVDAAEFAMLRARAETWPT